MLQSVLHCGLTARLFCRVLIVDTDSPENPTMPTSLATRSNSRLAEMAQSYKNRALAASRRNREAKNELMAKGEIVLGGAVAGATDALLGEGGDAEIGGVPVVPVVGALGVLAGFAGPRVVPGASHIGNVATGMLTVWVGNFVRDQVEERL